jgi:valyl-tRNA synthetase
MYHTALNAFEFAPALQAIEHFFWTDYCDNYIELVKHMLFNPSEYDEHLVNATRWTLYHVGLRLLQLYAPYIPFVTETMYQELYKSHEKAESLHATKFAMYRTPFVFDASAVSVAKIIYIASTVRKLKTEVQLSLKTPLSELVIHTQDAALVLILQKNETMLRGITQAHKIVYKVGDATPSNALTRNTDETISILITVE